MAKKHPRMLEAIAMAKAAAISTRTMYPIIPITECHAHQNKTVLDGITTEQVNALDHAAATDATNTTEESSS